MASVRTVDDEYRPDTCADILTDCEVCHFKGFQYAFCVDCEQTICKRCFEIHQHLLATKTHRIKRFQSRKQVLCREHKDKNRDVLCYDHFKFICEDCVNNFHASCHVKSFYDVPNVTKQESQLLIDQITEIQVKMIEAKKHTLKDIMDQKKVALNQINGYCDRIIQKLIQYKRHSKKEVSTIVSEEAKRIDSMTSEAIKKLNKLERSLIDHQQTLTALDSLFHLPYMITDIQETTRKFYNSVRRINIPEFWYSLEKTVGDVSFQGHSPKDSISSQKLESSDCMDFQSKESIDSMSMKENKVIDSVDVQDHEPANGIGFQKYDSTNDISVQKHVSADNRNLHNHESAHSIDVRKQETKRSMSLQTLVSTDSKNEQCRSSFIGCFESDAFDLELDSGEDSAYYTMEHGVMYGGREDILTKNIHKIGTKRMKVLNVQTVKDEGDCCITGLCATSSGHLLLADNYNKRVKLFSTNGKYLSCVQTSGEPFDITETGTEEAAVSMWMNMKTIQLLGIRKEKLYVKSSIKLRNRVCGIAAVGDDLAISCDDQIPSVQLIKRDGEAKWSLSFTSDGRKMFKAPGYIIIHAMDNIPHILVSDKEYHTVTVIEAQTGIIKRVCPQSKTGPHGMTADGYGNVYVGYFFKAGVCVWSSDMSDSTFLLSGEDEIKRPLAIVYSPVSCELLLSSWRCNTIERFKIL